LASDLAINSPPRQEIDTVDGRSARAGARIAGR